MISTFVPLNKKHYFSIIKIRQMSKVIKLKKGLNINLKGKPENHVLPTETSCLFAVKPTDFYALTPRLNVKVGDEVKAGSTLFFDKSNPKIRFASPVNGKIESINRGERRKLLEVVIRREGADIEYEDFGSLSCESSDRDAICEKMLESGVWPVIKQRPYGVIANPAIVPDAVFVSTFDSAPIGPDLAFIAKDEFAALQEGLNCLAKLCGKKVYLNLKYGADNSLFEKLDNVEINYFSGPHPAGSTGIQIHHIRPINKGDHLWTVDLQNVIIIGRLFMSGKYDARKIIAVSGSKVKTPAYCRIISGTSIENIVRENVDFTEDIRYISGNVLTGDRISENGFIGFYANQLSVIPEGNHYEFLGWAAPGLDKFSASKLFLSRIFPKKSYDIDTNYHGGPRAFVVNGEYEKVLPMDIYPVYLLKAVLAGDIDKMEQLGIYEILPEDFALCEFVCTSKTPVQEIVRKGIDIMLREVN